MYLSCYRFFPFRSGARRATTENLFEVLHVCRGLGRSFRKGRHVDIFLSHGHFYQSGTTDWVLLECNKGVECIKFGGEVIVFAGDDYETARIKVFRSCTISVGFLRSSFIFSSLISTAIASSCGPIAARFWIYQESTTLL